MLLLERLLLLLLLGLLFLVTDPAPFFFEFFVEEADAPSGFLADFIEDGEDFFLFAAGDKAFASDGEGAESDGGDAAVFDMRDDAAEVVRVGELHVVHFWGAGGHGGIGLGKEAHGSVVEHAGHDGGAFDQPGIISLGYLQIGSFNLPDFGKGGFRCGLVGI